MADNVIGDIVECDITRKRADTYPLTIKLKDSAAALLDVTGYSAIITLDPNKAPADNTANVFTANGVPSVTPADGCLIFDMSAITTVQPGNYHYDIQITDAGGFVRTAVNGRFKITQDITK